MTETAHTPGRWRMVLSSHQREFHAWIEDSESSKNIAAVFAHRNQEVHARLIAAAPELLAELTACYNFLAELSNVVNIGGIACLGPSDKPQLQVLCSRAAAAIEKAKGTP